MMEPGRFYHTCDHNGADVCLSQNLQHSGSLRFQLVLHNDQPQELHIGLYVIPKERSCYI